jgi:hypothetical protein
MGRSYGARLTEKFFEGEGESHGRETLIGKWILGNISRTYQNLPELTTKSHRG